MNGLFISFEGIEGSGKSTQIRLMSTYLNDLGYNTIITREPGGTNISEEIRKIILDQKNITIDSKVELLLYIASRAQHISELILPNIKKGVTVLCDRFSDSTVAYQGYGRGLDIEMIMRLNQYTEIFSPDLTILFDISPEKGLERIQMRKENNRLDIERIDFYHKVRQGYIELAKKDPERIKIVDADNKIEEVFEMIKNIISMKLGEQ